MARCNDSHQRARSGGAPRAGLPGLAAIAAGLLMLCQMLMAPACAAQSAPQIWFSPKQDNIDPSAPPGQRIQFSKYDFAAMLPQGAPWQPAAARIATFNLHMHTIEHFSDLAAVVAMTDRYGFQVSTAGSVVHTDGLCAPQGTEGVTPSVGYAREIVGAVKKWQRAGGRLDVFMLDGPFYYGYYAVASSCHYSITEVARRTFDTVHQIQLMYPNVKIVDSEGPGKATIDMWLPDYGEFLSQYQIIAGKPIDGVALDMHWADTWHTGYVWTTATAKSAAFLHHRGMQAGLIVNAGNEVATNAQWMTLNRQRLSAAASANLGLDFVCICSWARDFPLANLPESSADAYTSLVDSAAAAYGSPIASQ